MTQTLWETTKTHDGLSADGKHRAMCQTCEIKTTTNGKELLEKEWLVLDGECEGETVKQQSWYMTEWGMKQLKIEMGKVDSSLTELDPVTKKPKLPFAEALNRYCQILGGAVCIIDQVATKGKDGTDGYMVFFSELEALSSSVEQPASTTEDDIPF